MRNDPIVEEIRKARDAHASRFGYDLQAIYEDIKKQEQACGRELVRLSPNRLDDGSREKSSKAA